MLLVTLNLLKKKLSHIQSETNKKIIMKSVLSILFLVQFERMINRNIKSSSTNMFIIKVRYEPWLSLIKIKPLISVAA